MTIVTIGIDISKDKFDICLEIEGQERVSKVFRNSKNGRKAFLDFIPKDAQPDIGLESTGTYGRALVDLLHKHGYSIFVINPAFVSFYAKSLGRRAKTDQVDAKIICDYVRLHKIELRPWKPKPESVQKLTIINRALEDLKEDLIRTKGRIEACEHDTTLSQNVLHKLHNRQVKFLEKEISVLLKMASEVIGACPELKEKARLLQSIDGIGFITSLAFLAEIPDTIAFKSVKQLEAYVGVNPSTRQSGSSVRGRGTISKMGNSIMRKALYMPALSALRCNPIIQEFADRLKAKGKHPKVIIVAVMRKLLALMYGVLKNQKEFDRNYLKGN
jgi:transposase